jgi:hypothetical protein
LIRTGLVPPRSTVTCRPSTSQAGPTCVAGACQSVASLSSIRLLRTCAADTSSFPVNGEVTATASPDAVEPMLVDAQLGARCRVIVWFCPARNVRRKRTSP